MINGRQIKGKRNTMAFHTLTVGKCLDCFVLGRQQMEKRMLIDRVVDQYSRDVQRKRQRVVSWTEKLGGRRDRGEDAAVLLIQYPLNNTKTVYYGIISRETSTTTDDSTVFL